MIEVLKTGSSGKALATLAIGSKYLDRWQKHVKSDWILYCERNGLGLYVEDVDLDESVVKKKPQWQKLLIGKTLQESSFEVTDVCYLDSDILVNPYAPNIFESCHTGRINMVSQLNNLPYPLHEVLRRMAYLRNQFFDEKYPLDSSLFMDKEQSYGFQDLPTQADISSAGLFVFDVSDFGDWMAQVFYKYDHNVYSLSDGGDQMHINYEFQNTGLVNWIDYRFEAQWTFEMALKYPFLYRELDVQSIEVSTAVESSLFANYFLHFAGSWFESDCILNNNILKNESTRRLFESFANYRKQSVSGNSTGRVFP
jgi:hypothetical protein